MAVVGGPSAVYGMGALGHSGPLAQLTPGGAAGEMFLTGVPSWRYRIEQRNLTQTNGWQFVTNHTLATGTPTGFIRDVQATNSSSRIYRAVLPAP